tara:strand:+ start:653 stop:1309 length:657 start_codon:yes stop_codon:yes gene_type:complete
MEKEEYKYQVITNPTDLSYLLKALTGINMFENIRTRDIVQHRAFFCYLLNKKFNLGPTAIANWIKENTQLKTYDHSTAIYAIKKFKDYKKEKKEYFKDLEEYFDVKPDQEFKDLPKLQRLYMQQENLTKRLHRAIYKIKKLEEERVSVNRSKEEIEEAKKKLNNLKENILDGYTENELNYRRLTSDQKKVFDDRVSLILKSFNWNTDSNKYEVIYCGE